MSKDKENIVGATTKAPLNKKSKAAIIIAVIAAVIGIITAVCIANKTALISEITYIAMPKVIDTHDYDETLDLVLYVEKNDDFDPKADEKEPLKAFKYYYYDENGEKVTLNYDDPVFEGTDNETMVSSIFYFEVLTKLSGLRTAMTVVGIVAAVLVVIGLIVLWYILWSKKYDREKEKFNQNKGKKKRKKRI